MLATLFDKNVYKEKRSEKVSLIRIVIFKAFSFAFFSEFKHCYLLKKHLYIHKYVCLNITIITIAIKQENKEEKNLHKRFHFFFFFRMKPDAASESKIFSKEKYFNTKNECINLIFHSLPTSLPIKK